MSFFDKINGKNIELKVSEYSELYGEVLLGVHRDVKSLQSKVQTLSTLVENDNGEASPDVGVGARVQILRTKLRVAENLINAAKADHDREVPELRASIATQSSKQGSLESEVAAQFRSTRSQSEEVQRVFNDYRRLTEGRLGDLRTVQSTLERRVDDLASGVGKHAGDLTSLHAEHDKLERRVLAAERTQESSAAKIKALEAGADVLNREQNASRKSIQMIVWTGAGIVALIFVLLGVLLWNTKFAS